MPETTCCMRTWRVPRSSVRSRDSRSSAAGARIWKMSLYSVRNASVLLYPSPSTSTPGAEPSRCAAVPKSSWEETVQDLPVRDTRRSNPARALPLTPTSVVRALDALESSLGAFAAVPQAVRISAPSSSDVLFMVGVHRKVCATRDQSALAAFGATRAVFATTRCDTITASARYSPPGCSASGPRVGEPPIHPVRSPQPPCLRRVTRARRSEPRSCRPPGRR
jgi:hypothetical protein